MNLLRGSRHNSGLPIFGSVTQLPSNFAHESILIQKQMKSP